MSDDPNLNTALEELGAAIQKRNEENANPKPTEDNDQASPQE